MGVVNRAENDPAFQADWRDRQSSNLNPIMSDEDIDGAVALLVKPLTSHDGIPQMYARLALGLAALITELRKKA